MRPFKLNRDGIGRKRTKGAYRFLERCVACRLLGSHVTVYFFKFSVFLRFLLNLHPPSFALCIRARESPFSSLPHPLRPHRLQQHPHIEVIEPLFDHEH